MDIDFVEIDGVVVTREIVDRYFTCDLANCKGACCTMESPSGAPITESEIEEISRVLPVILGYLPKEHIKEIEKKSFWVQQYDGLVTRSMNNRECVFVYYDNDIARCGIENACRDGKINFLKPISCHLFPIRISSFGGPVLRYEKYTECEPAVIKGMQTRISILDFCKDSLVREFGKEWLNKIKERIKS
jgi:hypothetical protein